MWATAVFSVRKDERESERPPGDIAGLCSWLASQVRFVAAWTEDDAAALVADLVDLNRRYVRMVERRPNKKYFGPAQYSAAAAAAGSMIEVCARHQTKHGSAGCLERGVTR